MADNDAVHHPQFMKGIPWIGVDLDGTLAHYETWKGVEDIGEPIPDMQARVVGWLSRGLRVKIFTARMSEPVLRDKYRAKKAIELWCIKHLGVKLEVTNVKDMDMMELWDDRAVQVQFNSGKPVGYSTRGL